ncbi:tetratricopeptide repeat protein [Kamptonema sp. UHCC 0994]|uniref:tetratricopeptide repeat protein n=1 Tax=Kamptonema sp. UHCC 0994 TaxID=3031329 RepID=UPI0023BA6391|nr:tetratricopeptide repeat protein [Kamptonema sp. UHCC 0994]MDF0556591.1 tetratricopeptide repeat protein [Kamptonema sp. UHCC 0994]
MIGQLVDRRYRIIKVIGSNSLGKTYLAADTRRPGYPQCVVRELKIPGKSLETPQIIKVIFQRKAEIIEKLGKNDKIPSLLAYFEENQNLYLVEELIVGEPLTGEVTGGKPWTEEQAIAVLEEVLEILTFVHENGVIHRNIQPDHLIRRQSDGKLVLIGFRLDKEINPLSNSVNPLSNSVPVPETSASVASNSNGDRHSKFTSSLTKEEEGSSQKEEEQRRVLLTKEEKKVPNAKDSRRRLATEASIYTPIEQSQGNPQFNSDIYSLGMIVVQGLMGLSALELQKLKSDVGTDKILDRDRTSCSAALADTIDKMILPVGDRYQSAAEVLSALREIISPSQVSPPPQTIASPAMNQPVQKQPHKIIYFLFAGIASALILAAGIIYFWQWQAPARAKEFYERGVQKAKQGDKAGAIADYTQAIELNSKDTEAYYKRANTHYDLGAYQQAIQDYTQAIQVDPSNVKAYYNRGLVYSDVEDRRSAVQDFTQVIRLNPNDAEAYLERGFGYYKLGDHKTAIEDYTQAIRLNPNDAKSYSNRGLARSAAGDKQGAMSDFTQAIELNPKQASIYYSRGRARFNLADYKGAMEDFSQAITLDPNQADAYTNRCSAYVNLATYDKAIEDCTQAIALDPKDAEAYNNRCIARVNLGDYQKAAEDCSLTIGINGNNPKAYSNRGLARSAIGDKQGAIEDFSQAIRLNPSDAVAYSNRGIVYSEIKNYASAIEDFAQSIRLNPNNATAYYSRAIIRRELKDSSGANEDFQKAATLFLEQGRADAYKNAQAQISP